MTTPAIASLKDIRADKLPQGESVQKAYAEAAAVEEFADAWSAEWHYRTPKDVVAARLKDSLDKLQKAAASTPDNLDVGGAFDLAVRSLQQAHKLAPDDYRAGWFLGNHECQGGKIKEGMGAFLAVEGRSSWDHLSPAFWDDYIFCTSVANMPAHALRAGDHLSKLQAPPSQGRDSLMEIARKRFQTPDLSATYSGQEAWETDKEDSRLVFKSSMCGFSFSPLDSWKLRRLEVQNGLCVVQIAAGPHRGKAGDVVPNVLVIARQAKPEETLADFMKVFMNFPSPQTVAVSHCPSEQCLAYEAVVPGHYGKAGDGHVEITVFKRDAPEFPGLLFEEPAGPPVPKDGKVTYFHPHERFHRLDGTLYYLVMLDTADSVLADAKQDYDRLLKYMQAE
jgi:hypothetical protein